MMLGATLVLGCSAGLELGEVRVESDGDEVRTLVEVANSGTTPVWIWSEPVRLRPPGPERTAALEYDVEPFEESVIVEFFVPPPSEVLLPGERTTLGFLWPATVSIRAPEALCSEVEGDEPCAGALEVAVAWSRRPLTRAPSPDLDPWTAVDRLEDGVITADWVRPQR